MAVTLRGCIVHGVLCYESVAHLTVVTQRAYIVYETLLACVLWCKHVAHLTVVTQRAYIVYETLSACLLWCEHVYCGVSMWLT